MSKLDKKPIGSVSRSPGAAWVYGSTFPPPLPCPSAKLGKTWLRWRCTQTYFPPLPPPLLPKAGFTNGNYHLRLKFAPVPELSCSSYLHPKYLISVCPMHSDHSNGPAPSNITNAEDKTTPYGTLQTFSKLNSNWNEQNWVWVLLGQMMIMMMMITGVWW